MDYEKAYKAVLETARMWIKDGCSVGEQICLECVFPELRESDNLEEAAEDHIRKVVDATGHPGWDWETRDIEDAFKAGAKWQKAKMMEEAVEGEICHNTGVDYLNYNIAKLDEYIFSRFKVGDKVRIIIVNEEGKE